MIIRMHVRARHAASTLALAGLAVLAMPVDAKTIEYTYQVLKSPTRLRLDAAALSPLGEVVGRVSPKGDRTRSSTFALTSDGFASWTILGSENSIGAGVNASGDIVGIAYQSIANQAFLLPANGTAFALFAPEQVENSTARGINASGSVVGGYELVGSSVSVPYVWRNGTTTSLPTLGGSMNSAIAINDAGTIVGIVAAADDQTGFGARWDDGVMQVLPTPAGTRDATPVAISSNGIIGGEILTGTYLIRPCLWQNGQFVALPASNSTPASVSGVNAAGVAVGSATISPQSKAGAVIWRNGTITKLDKLVDIPDDWYIAEGLAINDAGQILVMGYDPKGNSNSMLLTPIAH